MRLYCSNIAIIRRHRSRHRALRKVRSVSRVPSKRRTRKRRPGSRVANPSASSRDRGKAALRGWRPLRGQVRNAPAGKLIGFVLIHRDKDILPQGECEMIPRAVAQHDVKRIPRGPEVGPEEEKISRKDAKTQRRKEKRT